MMTGQARLLLFVLLAAGTVGFLAGRSTAPDPEAGLDPVESPAPDRPTPPPATDRPPGSLAEALATIPSERIEAGDGEITGIVATEEGTPVEGVLVIGSLRRQRSRPRLAPGQVPEEKGIEEAVVELVRDRRSRQATRREARTGPDGRYRLTGIGSGRYLVQAYSTGYRIWAQNWYAEAGGEVNFKARLTAVLRFRVLDADGREAIGARVMASTSGSSTSSLTWKGADSMMEVQPGPITLTAFSALGDAKSNPLEVKAGVDSDVIVLQLRAVPGVRGRVIYPEGEDRQNPWVYVLRWSKPDDPTAREVRSGGKYCIAWGHEGSTYVFPDLGKGKWFLALVIDEHIVDSARIEVADRMLVKDLTLPPPDPKAFVVVTVVDPGGKPVTSAQFSVGHRHANGSSSRGCHAKSLGGGRYRVPHHVLEDEREYVDPEFYVRVTAGGLGSQKVAYDPATTRELTIRFETPAILTVRVPNAPEGWLGERLSVALESSKDRSGSTSRVNGEVLDPKTVKCGPVHPGEYTIQLRLQVGRHHNTIPLSLTAVSLAAGESEEIVSMPPLYPATIVMPKGMEKRQVKIGPARRRENHWSFSLTAKDGRVELPDLPAGRYRASLYGGRMEGPMEFSLPGPALLHFKAAVLNAMEISITKPDGMLAKAGFQDGDVIIGANGKLFETVQQASAAIMSSGKEGVPLIVLRGGRRIGLTVDFTPIFKSGEKSSLGGDVEPVARPE